MLHLIEQAGILDGDHGLVGKGLHEFDLRSEKAPGSERVNEKTPSTRPSRSSGTPSIARNPPISCASS